MKEKQNPFAKRKKRYAKLGKYTKFSRPALSRKDTLQIRRAELRGD